MELGAPEITELVTSIWKTVLDIDIEPDEDYQPMPTSDGLMTSCVQITGAWEGAVALYCTLSLGRKVAAAAFDKTLEAVADEDMQDILGELANIAGGNIKSMLPGPCQLSLPSVITGKDYKFGVLGSQTWIQLRFTCLQEPLHFALLQKDQSKR
jgi:chemotaxis protein CheX